MSKDNSYLTTRGAKHTHFSSDDEESSKEKENPPKDVEKIEVHSANSWEEVDMGDGERKNKFLRLMGASKKNHKGRFVIGDSGPHEKASDKKGKDMNEKLEEQYKQSMEHRLTGGKGSHIGLGFHDNKPVNPDDEVSCASTVKEAIVPAPSTDPQEKLSEKEKCKTENEDRKRHSDAHEKDEGESDVKKLKFVKSSSND